MIGPQKLLISLGTRQKISAVCDVEIFLRVVLTEKNVKTIFGG
jgi:hypothetical protein